MSYDRALWMEFKKITELSDEHANNIWWCHQMASGEKTLRSSNELWYNTKMAGLAIKAAPVRVRAWLMKVALGELSPYSFDRIRG